MINLLDLKQVRKQFDGLVAVDDLTFSLQEGELVGLIGPNGAGKTTVFNIISGVYRPTAGEVLHRGAQISGLDPYRIARRGIARTFQNIRMFSSLTVFEHILVAQSCRGSGFISDLMPFGVRSEAARRRDGLELLESVGLADRRNELAIHLPYGAQRRLEIARALATSPEILLLDEPAAGLNETETRELRTMLETLRSRRHTILLVEHDMKLVMQVCSRIVVLNFGKMIGAGVPAEIRTNAEVIDAYLGVAH